MVHKQETNTLVRPNPSFQGSQTKCFLEVALYMKQYLEATLIQMSVEHVKMGKTVQIHI